MFSCLIVFFSFFLDVLFSLSVIFVFHHFTNDSEASAKLFCFSQNNCIHSDIILTCSWWWFENKQIILGGGISWLCSSVSCFAFAISKPCIVGVWKDFSTFKWIISDFSYFVWCNWSHGGIFLQFLLRNWSFNCYRLW